MVSTLLYAVHKQNTRYKMKRPRIRCDIMADSFTWHTANDAVTTVRYYDVTPIVSVGADATGLHKGENIEKYNVLNCNKILFRYFVSFALIFFFSLREGLSLIRATGFISDPPSRKKNQQ